MSLKSWFIEKGVLYMLGKFWTWIDGRKMYIGGVGFILTGLGQLISTYLASRSLDHDGWANVVKGYLLISAKSAISKVTPPS